jgi:hypothetical protein
MRGGLTGRQAFSLRIAEKAAVLPSQVYRVLFMSSYTQPSQTWINTAPLEDIAAFVKHILAAQALMQKGANQ